jgi:hypothetical protein
MPAGTKIQSLKEFLNEVESSDVRSYLDLRGFAVEANEADKIKNRMLEFYKGIESAHCFCDESGQIFDCIPWNQYPTHKAISQEKIEPPPPSEPSISTIDDRETHVPPQLSPGKKDLYGSEMYCESGAVAMRRYLLSEFVDPDIYRYSNKKSDKDQHRYAHAWQPVKLHHGLGSTLNVWYPKLDPTQNPAQNFSLSQIWCAAGENADNSRQTVEAGWHVVSKFMGEAIYGKENWSKLSLSKPNLPHLFIYWTPDNYGRKNPNKVSKTSYAGSILELSIIKEGFKLVAKPSYVPGMALGPVSVLNGRQKEIALEWRLWKGGWWLGVGYDRDGQPNWVGSYDTSLFGQGGALASWADVIDFGGETCCGGGPPEPTFPPMGSGTKPTGNFDADFRNVAYHRKLFYYKPDGERELAKPDLRHKSNEPGYGIYVTAKQDTNWLNCFFFGGPGGKLPDAFREYAPPAEAPAGA